MTSWNSQGGSVNPFWMTTLRVPPKGLCEAFKDEIVSEGDKEQNTFIEKELRELLKDVKNAYQEDGSWEEFADEIGRRLRSKTPQMKAPSKSTVFRRKDAIEPKDFDQVKTWLACF